MAYTINQSKEDAAARRPLLLAAFTFPDGSVLRASTHNGTGGYAYGGNSYEPLIDDQEIDRLSSLSEQGIDLIPQVTIRLADPAGQLWQDYELAAGKGFKGAQLVLRFLLYDTIANEYSTDSFLPFVGPCDKPGIDAQFITVTARGFLNLAAWNLPTAPIQERCLWVNPATTDQRSEASDPESTFYPCGETRDLTTAPPCSYTRETCTQPNRFSGDTFVGPTSFSGREYTSGSKVNGRNADTSGKRQDFWPLWLGGHAWIDCPVLNQMGEPNTARGEAAVGIGAIVVERVIVNGIEMSYAPTGTGDFQWRYSNDGSRDGTPNPDPMYGGQADPRGGQTVIFFQAPRQFVDPTSQITVRVKGYRKSLRAYKVIDHAYSDPASADRITVVFTGPNGDVAGNPPYEVHISGNSLADGDHQLYGWGTNQVTLMDAGANGASVSGGLLWYETNATWNAGGNGASTPWLIMEALRNCRLKYADFDAPYFVDSSIICNGTVQYTDQNGETAYNVRFSNAVALRERRPAAEVVRGLRMSIGGLLVPGPDGRIRLKIEGPLAEQQPAPVDGSNYNTAISSTLRNGTTANGYVAYSFDESNSWNLRTTEQQLDAMPNRVSFPFSDPTRDMAVSTFALVDSDDVARVGSEAPGGLQVQPEGIASYNHALRCARLGLAKIHRGNPQGDTRGTNWFQWETSFRGCKLAVGQIVRLSSTRLNLTNQLVRLTAIKPAKNYETVTLAGHWHSDSWYLDSHGNAQDPGYQSGGNDSKLPMPWAPGYVTVTPTGSALYDLPGSLFDSNEYTFGLEPVFSDADVDPVGNPIPKLSVTGYAPVNRFSDINSPTLGRQGTTATTGGTIPGAAGVPGGFRRLYAVLCSRDAAGAITRRSEMAYVDITSSTNTNTATFPVTSWGAGTTGYVLYAGWALHELRAESEGTGTPASITITALTRGGSLPDQAADRLLVKIKRIQHAGVFGTRVAIVGTGTLMCSGADWTVNQWAGRDLSVLFQDTAGPLLPLHFHVTSNTADTLTVTPDPLALGVTPECVIVMRSIPSVSGLTLTDLSWVNSLGTTGLNVDEEKGRMVRAIAGTGAGESYLVSSNTHNSITIVGPWRSTPWDQTTRYVVEDAIWLPEQGDSLPISNGDPATLISMMLPVPNYRETQLRVAVYTLDAEGNETLDSAVPTREIYIPGYPPGVKTVTADYQVGLNDKTIWVDSTNGALTITLLPGVLLHGRSILIKKISSDGNIVTIAAWQGETIDDSETITLTTKGDFWQVTADKNG